MDFDTYWKTEAVRIAVMEQLEVQGEISLDTLFVRAKDIYNRGYQDGIDKWKSVWLVKPEPKKKVKKTEEKEVSKSDTKICPNCGESVPKGWSMHMYKKNGEGCGYKWMS